MSKKFQVLSLSLMIVIFAISSAAAMSYRYELNGVDYAVPEILENETEEGIAGYNYKAEYSLPVLTLTEFNANDNDDDGVTVAPDKYKISWRVEAGDKLKGLNYDFDNENLRLKITGVLPESDDTYEFQVVAEISECEYQEAVGTHTNFDSEYKIYVHPADHEPIAPGSEFDSIVKPADKVELNKATPDYSVTVKAPQHESHHELVYSAYIENENGKPVIDLPDWLKYEVSEKLKDEYDEEQIAAVIITFNKNAKVNPGTKAVIHVLFTADKEDKYKSVGWNVEYAEKEVKEDKTESEPKPKKGWFSW